PYTERISISQLSKNFGINRTKMKQLFKEQYHYSIYQYFIHLRMTHAYLLVQTTTLQFKEIAYMVGYKDYSTFVKYFYRTYNQLPKEIRGQRTANSEQRTVNSEQRTANREQRTENRGQERGKRKQRKKKREK